MLFQDSLSPPLESRGSLDEEITKYINRFEDYLRQDFYLFNLLSPTEPKPLPLVSAITKNTYHNQKRISTVEPASLKHFPCDLKIFTNVNLTPKYYLEDLAYASSAKGYRVYLGYDEDLGPMCLSIFENENAHTVYIRSNWRTSKIDVDSSMLAPSPVPTPQIISSKAYSVIIYLALEKYMNELEEDWFRLLTWQQKINYSSPYNQDIYEKFKSDHKSYISDLKAAVTFSISAPQIAKEDLHRIVRQFELVEDPSVRVPLINLEHKMAQRYIYTDIILHFSGSSRTMEQRDTYNVLLQIFGQMLVNQGTVVDHEALELPKIITEESSDFNKVQERRKMIFEELVDTELRYVKKLQTILKVFISPLRQLALESRPVILQYDIKALFNNIEDITALNEKFLFDLMHYDPSKGNLGSICEKHILKFDLYHSYIAGYNYSLEYTCALERKNNSYYNFIMNAREHPECEKLAIKDLIVMPVQRLPRYKLLFTEYLRFTQKHHPEYQGLYNALKRVNEISNLGGQRLSENAIELSKLLNTIQDCPAKILSSSRYLVTHLDCIESDISTFSPQENITLYLLNDSLIITRHPKEHSFGRKKSNVFLSWINLIGIEVLDPGNSDGILIRGCLDFSEDLYWDHQEIHFFVALNSSDKERFYGELCKAMAICKAKVTGSSCFYQTVNDITLFFFIYKAETYDSSHHKSEISLRYVEDLTEPTVEFHSTQNSSLVHGLILGVNCMFNLRLGSKVPYSNLEAYVSLDSSLPKDPQKFGGFYCTPIKFQELLFHHLVYSSFALRATPAYLHKQHLINRCLMESLFGLHFPSCKNSHPYLAGIKSFSRTIKDDRHVLISNGAFTNIQPRRNPLKQHNRHHLGTRKMEPFRDISKARSLTDPEPDDSIKPKIILPFASTSLRARSSSISVSQLSSSMDSKVETKPSVIPRKKKGSFSKMTRFFSWNK